VFAIFRVPLEIELDQILLGGLPGPDQARGFAYLALPLGIGGIIRRDPDQPTLSKFFEIQPIHANMLQNNALFVSKTIKQALSFYEKDKTTRFSFPLRPLAVPVSALNGSLWWNPIFPGDFQRFSLIFSANIIS